MPTECTFSEKPIFEIDENLVIMYTGRAGARGGTRGAKFPGPGLQGGPDFTGGIKN